MKSIRGKILLCMSLTVMIVLIILGVTSVYLIYSSNIQLLEQTMKETAELAAERVSEELTAYTNVAIDAGATALLADPTQSAESKKEIIDQRAALNGFLRGNIIGANGISIFDGNDYSDREYFQKAMQGISHVSEPLISKITGKFSIMIAAPLWENGIVNTKVIGAVYFVPQETFLNDIVSQINISENSVVYAINADGITIADNTLDTVMKQNIEEESKSDTSLKQLAKIHEKMRQGERGFSSYKINKIKKFSAYAPISSTDGWSMGITIPQSDIMGTTYFAITITIVLLIISLIAASVIAYRLANEIGEPIKLCTSRLKALANGDLKSSIPKINSKDETKILAQATDSIVDTIQKIIMDIDWSLSEMASGNFKIDSKVHDLYVGDFKSLEESIYKILKQLTNTLLQINNSAQQVASGSNQVSEGAQALSEGAEHQAASVEELAATINNISEQVRQNAQNAIEANGKTSQVNIEVSQSNQRMQKMLLAMSQINDSANEIEKIVKTIEEIAFQINLLALNIAIEAARAGEAGKEFAVVAIEVQNLSTRSTKASKDTTALIEKTLEAIDNGTEIASETAKSLLAVVESVKEVSGRVEQISNASDEQADSIEQVTQGIDQISNVVQINSVTAKESALVSEKLSEQSQVLKDLVGWFLLKKESTYEKEKTNI